MAAFIFMKREHPRKVLFAFTDINQKDLMCPASIPASPKYVSFFSFLFRQ